MGQAFEDEVTDHMGINHQIWSENEVHCLRCNQQTYVKHVFLKEIGLSEVLDGFDSRQELFEQFRDDLMELSDV